MASRPRPVLANLLLFGRALRSAGLAVTHGQVLDFARALELVDLGSRDQVFFAARAFLVNRKEEHELFELLFDRFWRFAGSSDRGASASSEPVLPRFDPRSVRALEARLRDAGSALSEEPGLEITVRDRSGTFSQREVLQHKDFAELTPPELAELKRLVLGLSWRASRRRTRRWQADRRGARLHLRRVLRQAARHGGAALSLARRRRKIKRRPIVLLADVSGSMEKYSHLILQFFYGALHGFGAGQVECFVFGTRLTRITSSMRIRNVDRALEDAAAEILDWSGGTRIGTSLGAFNRLWARRVLRRGAVVIIVSDGWERGDVAELGRELRHLQHRCHRLIWLNPHVARPGYEPLVEGMRTALPFVDDFLPVHNLSSLRDLASILSELPERRRSSAPRLEVAAYGNFPERRSTGPKP